MAQPATTSKNRGGDGSTLTSVLEKKSERIPYEVAEEERMSGSRVRFKLKIKEEDFKGRLEETMSEYSKSVRLPGFRPGKAPKNLVRRAYETPAREDTVKGLVSRLTELYTEDKGLDALTQPHLLDWKSTREDGTEIEIALEVRPDINIADDTLQGLEAKAHRVNVDDAYVAEELEQLRLRNAEYEPTDEGYQPSDALLFTCSVTTPDGDVIPERCVDQYYCTKVEEELPEEVAAALAGKKKGEFLSMDIEEPSDANPNVKETVHYELEIHEVKRRTLPALDDEFAQDVSEKFDTLDQLRQSLRENAIKQEEGRQRQEILNEIFATLRDRLDFDLPRAMVEDTRNRSLYDTEQRLNQMGLSLKSLGDQLVNQVAANMHEQAKVSVKNSLIMKKLEGHFDVEVGEEEIQKALGELAERAGRKPLAIRADLEARKEWDAFLDDLRVRAAADKLISLANVSYKDVTREELKKIEAEREQERQQAGAQAAASETGPADAPEVAAGEGEEPKA